MASRLRLFKHWLHTAAASGARIVLVAAFFVLNVHAESAWKPPTTPKDDQHWYPEFPPGPEGAPHASVPNPGFEEAREDKPAGPKGWAHPDGLTSFWINDGEHGKVIQLDTDVFETDAKKRQAEFRECMLKKVDPPPITKREVGDAHQYDAIGATYGVSIYSEKIACKPKQAYKISFDFRGPGGGAMVWVRGWGGLPKDTGSPNAGEDRRLWETYVSCRTKGDGWRHFEQEFHPTRRPLSKDTVKFIEINYLRVMLYAFWPRGKYEFDNIKIEEISDEEYFRLKKIDADAK